MASSPAASYAPPQVTTPPFEARYLQLAAWLTVERLLWSLLIALAATVRLLDLAHFSLNEAEAMLSTAALSLLGGNPEATLHASPFVVTLDAIIFTIVGANDATARVVSALAGIAPVALTYQLRGSLGRWGALVTAALFALSPTFLYHSRTANGEIVAVAGMFAALVGAWAWMRRQDARMLYLAAAGLAVAITAGQAAYTVLLIVASFAAIAFGLRVAGRPAVPEIEALMNALHHSPSAHPVSRADARQPGASLWHRTSRNALILFALVALASATAALLNPLGLQATLNLAADWLAPWQLPSNHPASYFVQLFVMYELLPLIFGVAGLLYYLARGDRLATFFAWWLALSLLWYTLAPAKSASALLVILIPLILMAGRLLGEMLTALFNHSSMANEGIFILLGLLTCGIFGLNLSNYAQTQQQSYLIVTAIALAMLLLIGVLVTGWAGFYREANHAFDADSAAPPLAVNAGWQTGLRRALPILGTIMLVGLLVLFVHSSMDLNFNEADDPREAMVETPTTMEARELKPMLEELSSRWEGDPHTAPIAADSRIGPTLSWYLRDFQKVRYFDVVPLTASEPIVLVAANAPQQPGFADYAAHRMRWQWQKPAEPLEGTAYLRWLLFRGLHDVPPSYDIIIYAQKR